MAQVSSSLQIDASPEATWALLSDPHRYPDYVDATDRMLDIPDSEFGVGYVYREHGGIRPFVGESEWVVTEFDPIRHQAHMGDDGKMRMPLSLDVEPTDGGSRLTITIGLKPRWYLAPVNAILWPLMMRSRAQDVLDKTVANAKRILESSG